MKIISRGTPPETRPYRAECRHCETVFEFLAAEAERVFDQREGDFFRVKCPVARLPRERRTAVNPNTLSQILTEELPDLTPVQRARLGQRIVAELLIAGLEGAEAVLAKMEAIEGRTPAASGWHFEHFTHLDSLIATKPDGAEIEIRASDVGSAQVRKLLNEMAEALSGGPKPGKN